MLGSVASGRNVNPTLQSLFVFQVKYYLPPYFFSRYQSTLYKPNSGQFLTHFRPQYNVTEVVIQLDSNQAELRRTVALISESTSKLHAAKNCPMRKCKAILGCVAFKKDENGCQTCQCAGKWLPDLLVRR